MQGRIDDPGNFWLRLARIKELTRILNALHAIHQITPLGDEDQQAFEEMFIELDYLNRRMGFVT